MILIAPDVSVNNGTTVLVFIKTVFKSFSLGTRQTV